MKTFSTILLLFLGLILSAQTPQAIKYQTVARDAAGNVLADRDVSFRISILKGSPSGSTAYSETHSGTTNTFGLINLEIGNGLPVTNIFSGINWGLDIFFVKVEMDPNGGSSYQWMGTSQLLSVPYALYAKDVQNNNDADADPANEIQKISISGTVLTLDKSGGSVTLPSSGGGDNWGTQTVATDATLSGNGTTSTPIKIADNGVNSSKIADGSIASADIANSAVTTDKLNAGAVSGAKIAQAGATIGQALKWNGTTWVPAVDETGPASTTPTGPAGGDLSGTYPNPAIGDSKVTSVKILDASIATSDLANNSVTTDKINAGAVTGAKIAQAGATSGQALKWNGTTWVPAVDETGPASTTPTGPAGGDLSGTYPNPAIGDSKVTSVKILDASIATSDLANNSVTTDKINAGAVTGAKIAQAGATSGQALKWNGTTWAPAADETGTGIPTGPAGGDLTGTYPNPTIGDGKVTSAKIFDGTISTADIASNAVTTEKIYAGAITGAKIAQASATTGQALKWNGTTWAPASDAIALPYSGTGTSDSPLFDINNLGTSGAISTFSSGNYGIWGESGSSTGIGVYGVNKTSAGTTYGVFGDVYSPTGFSGFFQGGKFYIKGNTGIGTQDPTAKLEVNGQVKITGGSPGTGKVLTSDGAGLATWQTPEPNVWLKNSNNIYYNTGDVGIGLNNPAGMLEIYGNSVDYYPTLLLSEADGYARVSFRTMQASAKHWVLAGHTNQTDGESQWHLNYFNGSVGKNIFSMYGDSRIAFDGNVGIGTATPSSKLEVAGQVKITGGAPGTGKILTSDATGLASWQTPTWLRNNNHLYYTNGNVAIGTSYPRYELTIYQDNDPRIGFYNSTSGTSGTDGFTISTGATGSPVWIWNWENSNIHFGTDNTNRMIINADGHVSMMRSLDLNTESTFGALYVKGKQALWCDGTYFSWGYDAAWNYFANKISIGRPLDPGGYMLYIQGPAYSTESWNSSDVRFKKNILPISGALEKVLKVSGKSFEFRNGEFKDYHFAEGKQYGFIAQELEKEFPEVVKTESDGYKSVNYNGMIPVLLEAIKEQQKVIERLKTDNGNLNTRLEKMEKIFSVSDSNNE